MGNTKGEECKTECVHSYKHTLRTFRRSIHHKHNSKVKIIFTNLYFQKTKQNTSITKLKKNDHIDLHNYISFNFKGVM